MEKFLLRLGFNELINHSRINFMMEKANVVHHYWLNITKQLSYLVELFLELNHFINLRLKLWCIVGI